MAAVLTLLMFVSSPLAMTAQRPTSLAELLKQGQAAIEARRFAEALAAFESATKQAPQNPDAWFGAGMASFWLGRGSDAESALRQAISLEPGFTDASAWLGEIQYRSGRITDAIATYEAAVKHAPSDKYLLQGLERWRRQVGVERRFIESRGVHFRVQFEGPEDQALARRAVEMLEAAYLRTGTALHAYPTQPVEVVLYTEQQFYDITRSPSWAGGLYDGRIRVPIKGASASMDQLQEVLEHEFVHALVANISGPGVPRWLNEGLATFLEPDGLASARTILDAVHVRIPMTRLHDSFDALPGPVMALAYAQSTAAVAKMLERGAPAVVMLLRDIGAGVAFETAFHRRIGVPYSEFQHAFDRQ